MRGKRSKRRADREAGPDEEVKEAKPVGKRTNRPLRALRQVISSPDFGYQAVVILLSLAQGNFPMERRLNTMTSSVDALRNITGVIDNAMTSLKTAADAPRQIRQLIKPGSAKI